MSKIIAISGIKNWRVLTANHWTQKAINAGEDGMEDIALELYHRALEYNPHNHTALINVGVIYTSKNDHLKAEEYFRKAVEYFKDSHLANGNLAIVLNSLGRESEAFFYYKEAIRLGSVDSLYNIALLSRRMVSVDEAVGYLERYLKCDQSSEWLEFARAEIRRLKGVDVVEIKSPTQKKLESLKKERHLQIIGPNKTSGSGVDT